MSFSLRQLRNMLSLPCDSGSCNPRRKKVSEREMTVPLGLYQHYHTTEKVKKFEIVCNDTDCNADSGELTRRRQWICADIAWTVLELFSRSWLINTLKFHFYVPLDMYCWGNVKLSMD